MLDFNNRAKKELEPILEHLLADCALIHTGRATPALIENISVPAYGGAMPLQELASLSAPDARSIIVQPWDISLMGDIQKALESSHTRLGMVVQENHIRLTLPPLSAERRDEMIKLLGKKVEAARISVRRVRDHIGKSIDEALKNKELSEDGKFRAKDALQKIIDEYSSRMADLERKKEADIRS